MPAYAKASHMYNNKVLAEALEVAHLKSIIAMELSAGPWSCQQGKRRSHSIIKSI